MNSRMGLSAHKPTLPNWIQWSDPEDINLTCNVYHFSKPIPGMSPRAHVLLIDSLSQKHAESRNHRYQSLSVAFAGHRSFFIDQWPISRLVIMAKMPNVHHIPLRPSFNSLSFLAIGFSPPSVQLREGIRQKDSLISIAFAHLIDSRTELLGRTLHAATLCPCTRNI